MKTLLIGMAAAAAIVLPTSASAADSSWHGHGDGHMPQVHRHHGSPNQPVFVDPGVDLRHSHGDGLSGWYDLSSIDFNRSWAPNSYNDWWHDRPDRAYPRWVQHNEGCDEGRVWQGGGVWRCSW